jgi:hypothetical protein
MAWLVVDGRDNTESVFEYKPIRANTGDFWHDCGGNCVELPQGTIKKLIGRELTWDDNPVELK